MDEKVRWLLPREENSPREARRAALMCAEKAGIMKDMETNPDVDHSLYKQQAYPSEH